MYDLSVKAFELNGLKDGSYEIVLEIEAHKWSEDGLGKRKESPFRQERLMVKIENSNGQDSIYNLPTMSNGINRVKLELNLKPKRMIIDPLEELIDLNRENNSIRMN